MPHSRRFLPCWNAGWNAGWTSTASRRWRGGLDCFTGSHYKATKKTTKDANARANTVAAFLLIELVITTILAVLAAGVHVPIVGSSDSAAKKEDRKEDGAPPKAEEQA